MANTTTRLAAMTVLLLPLISGCASSLAPAAGPAASPLNGNWLITGDMPDFPGALARTFGISATLDVINGQVYAQSAYFYPCSNSGSGASGSLPPAPIQADGSFTLQPFQTSIVIPTVLFTVHGSVPSSTSGTWSGSYSATNANTGCAPVSGTFTATRIQPVSGTFSGSVSFHPVATGIINPAAVPATVQFMLQQGGPASLDSAVAAQANITPATGSILPPLTGTGSTGVLTGSFSSFLVGSPGVTTFPVISGAIVGSVGVAGVDSVNALTGTVTVQGIPCAAGGTVDVPSGAVFGSQVSMFYKSTDGSLVTIHGQLEDPTSSSLSITSIFIAGGACDGWFGSGSIPFVKQ
jgi:hypothetical protein